MQQQSCRPFTFKLSLFSIFLSLIIVLSGVYFFVSFVLGFLFVCSFTCAAETFHCYHRPNKQTNKQITIRQLCFRQMAPGYGENN